jgi:penicillin-binding protein 1A
MVRHFFETINDRKNRFVTFFKAQSNVKKVLIVGSFFTGLIFAGVLFLFVLVWSGALGSLPGKNELASVENPAASEVYSADSVLLGRYYIQERSNIQAEDIPQHVTNAVLATEDVRFYDHEGIDVVSLFRVLFKSILLQQESSGGGSTLTQQLAKNLYPRKRYYFLSLPVNKIREMIIASRLESIFSKEEVFTLYMNTVPFGDNTYGIEAAAQRFFSVPTRSLTADQAAVLVGMLKATNSYNPRIYPERSRQRRNIVLAQMEKYNMLSKEEAARLKNKPLKLSYKNLTHHSGSAPYFREYIRPELEEWCRTNTKDNGDPYNLYTDGLKIYTTIDSRVQQYAEEAVKDQMTIIQEKFARHWGKRVPWHNQPGVVEDALKRSDHYKILKEKGMSEQEIRAEMGKPSLMNIFTWKGEKEVNMTPMDSIKHYLSFLNAGVLALDPHKGAVRAWVGGIDHRFFQYDHIKESTKRQVGSTFKPIVYAAALQQGVRPCQFISAERTVYTNIGGAEEWSPENADNEKYDLKFSMEGALAYSVNTVSVKILEKAGIDNTIGLARKMGITSDMPVVPSLALGVADISMWEMVCAYSSFANNGKSVKPFYITSITTHNNQVLEKFTQDEESKQVLSPENAQMVLQMLKRTVDEGTGAGLRSRYGITNDIGGKTGTTQSNADGWFIGVMPRLVIGAWVGADDPRIRFRSTALGQGASTALPIVASLLQKANKDKSLRSITQARFPEPSREVKSRLSCDLYKSDENFFDKLFGKKEEKKETRRAFGEKEKGKGGFFRRLFGRN